ncbi:MAG: cobalamin biosynthesis protein [Clostridium sp.]
MKIEIISFTRKAGYLNKTIAKGLCVMGHSANSHTIEKFSNDLGINGINDIKKWMGDMFYKADHLVFIGACGIAIRLIAPYVSDKTKDPGVISLDENGENIISLLSGHIGGANRLAKKISDITGGRAIISTGTDINNKFSVDEFASINNLYIDDMKIAKDISSNILENKQIAILSDFPIISPVPKDLRIRDTGDIGICISVYNKKPYQSTLSLIPKIVSIGIGCRRDIHMDIIEEFVLDTLDNNNISILSIKNICSIDIKSNEVGIIDFAKKYNLDFLTFTGNELKSLSGEFTASEFVNSITGVDNVCERAAIMGSGGDIILKKTSKCGVTLAIAIRKWGVDFEG